MRRIIQNLLISIAALAFFAYVYINIFNATATVVVVIVSFLFLYGLCMWLSQESMKALKIYALRRTSAELPKKDRSRVLFFCLSTHATIFLCVLLVSFIPSFGMVLAIPMAFLVSAPAKTVYDEYFWLTHKKLPFILSFIAILIVCLSTGTIVMSFFI